MRRILPILLALLLTFAIATPVTAHKATGGWFTNSAIGDGRLSTCFVGGTPVHTNRGILNEAIRAWGFTINLQIDSLGACPKAGTNIAVGWTPLHATCAAEVARTEAKVGGYSSVTIWLNSNCGANAFYWGVFKPVPQGLYDAWTLMVHESGHALGLHHENAWDPHNQSNDLMDIGAAGCFNGNRSTLSFDDAAGMKWRYAGLALGGNPFPQPAVCQD